MALIAGSSLRAFLYCRWTVDFVPPTRQLGDGAEAVLSSAQLDDWSHQLGTLDLATRCLCHGHNPIVAGLAGGGRTTGLRAPDRLRSPCSSPCHRSDYVCSERCAQGSFSGRSAKSQVIARKIRGVAQPGSAPALGAGGRGFKSPLPDSLTQLTKLTPLVHGRDDVAGWSTSFKGRARNVYPRQSRGRSSMARVPAFQAGYAGSIPVARSPGTGSFLIEWQTRRQRSCHFRATTKSPKRVRPCWRGCNGFMGTHQSASVSVRHLPPTVVERETGPMGPVRATTHRIGTSPIGDARRAHVPHGSA